jgi:hypothetical protein
MRRMIFVCASTRRVLSRDFFGRSPNLTNIKVSFFHPWGMQSTLSLLYYSLQKPKETPYYTKNILHNTTILRTYNQIISVKQSLLTLVYSVQTFRGFFDSFLRLDGAFNDASLAERADFRFLLRVWRLRVRRGWRVGG